MASSRRPGPIGRDGGRRPGATVEAPKQSRYDAAISTTGLGGDLTPILLRIPEGRVGSTLLMQLLGSSPAIAFDRVYPFEHRYLTYFIRIATRIGEPFDFDRWNLDDLLLGSDDRIGSLPFNEQIVSREELAVGALKGLWSSFSDAVRTRATDPVRYYAEKSYGDLSLALASGLRPILIDLVRDPRDVVVSVRSFNAKRSSQGFGRDRVATDDEHLEYLIDGMRRKMHEMQQPIEADRIVVRYEDLVLDLPGEARRLEDRLEVRLDEDAVVRALPEMAHHVTAPSSRDSVGRWNAELSPSEVAIIEERMGAVMRPYGYEPAT